MLMQVHGTTGAMRRALPGLAYAISLIVCAGAQRWLATRWGRLGDELTWFVLAPALLAAGHAALARQAEGRVGFRFLGALWGGAAVCGLLSHWQWLDAVGPWLSLVRYALIALAGSFFALSVVMARPLFAGADRGGPLLGRIALGVVGGAMLLAGLSGIALVLYLTPFRMALAPPEPGLRYERIWRGELYDYFGWLAWSPDSRWLLGQSGRVWLLDAKRRDGSLVVRDGMITCDNPWNAAGDGFWYASSDGRDTYLSFCSTRLKAVRKLRGGQVGVPTCSPDGAALAFDTARGLVVAKPDGSGPRVVAASSEVPRWSLDGKRLLVTRLEPEGRRYWVVTVEGESWPVDVPVAGLGEVAWVSGDTFATISVRHGPRIPRVGVRRSATLSLWSITGKRVRDYDLGSYVGGTQCSLAGTIDGRRLAIGLDARLPFGSSLVMLDLKTGRMSRLPAPSYTPGGLAWSPDGRSLALSDVVEEDHGHGHSSVAVVSGFKLFRKEKTW